MGTYAASNAAAHSKRMAPAITAVGPRASTAIPPGTEVIDVSGKFIVPGLTDVFATIDRGALLNPKP